MRHRRQGRACTFRALAAVLLMSALSRATVAEQTLFLGGTQVSPVGTSSYIGLLQPILGGRLGQGWFLRPWLSYTTYRYRSGSNIVHATVPGTSLGVGYAWSDHNGSRSVSIAPGYQNTRLDPLDLGNSARGEKEFLLLGGQWWYNFSARWNGDVIANYAVGTQDYWSRLRLGYEIDSRTTVGPAFVYQGGPSYTAWQTGLFVDWSVTPRWALGMGGGYLKNSGISGEGYVGLNLSFLY